VAANIFRQQQRACREGRQNIAGQLGCGKREERDRHDEPDHEKCRQGILGLEQFPFLFPPDSDRFCESCANKHRPGHKSEQDDGQVIPEGLRVVIKVLPKSFEIVLEDEYTKELRISQLDRDVPGKRR